MLKVLEGFHHQVCRRIAGMSDGQVGWELCECSSVLKALETAGMWPMK